MKNLVVPIIWVGTLAIFAWVAIHFEHWWIILFALLVSVKGKDEVPKD